MRVIPPPNCCVCGRFCKWTSDRSTPFGTSQDLEPPPDEFYCAGCAKKEEEHYVGRGWVPNDWIKAEWQRRAAERLGLVEVFDKGCAWSYWKAAA